MGVSFLERRAGQRIDLGGHWEPTGFSGVTSPRQSSDCGGQACAAASAADPQKHPGRRPRAPEQDTGPSSPSRWARDRQQARPLCSVTASPGGRPCAARWCQPDLSVRSRATGALGESAELESRVTCPSPSRCLSTSKLPQSNSLVFTLIFRRRGIKIHRRESSTVVCQQRSSSAGLDRLCCPSSMVAFGQQDRKPGLEGLPAVSTLDARAGPAQGTSHFLPPGKGSAMAEKTTLLDLRRQMGIREKNIENTHTRY